FEVPTGPGIRTDTCGYAGYRPSPSFDSLLAKLVVRVPSGDFPTVLAKTYRALGELRAQGVATNLPFLQNLLRQPALGEYRVTPRFVDEHRPALLAAPDIPHRRVHAEAVPRRAGVKVDPRDPLAVLVHGKTAAGDAPRAIGEIAAGEGTVVVRAPMQGTIVAVDVSPGDAVPAGAQVLVMEAMKMEHVVTTPVGGIVRTVGVGPGDTVYEDHPLVVLEESAVEGTAAVAAGPVDPDRVRPDLAEVQRRHERTRDAARPD